MNRMDAMREMFPTPADDAEHILIVDDDHRIRDLLSQYLMESGFRTSTAKDVATARNRLSGMTFDLLVLDVMMPGESGMSLAKDLKGADGLPVPILMLTAQADPDDRIMGLEAGVDDYLTKPFEPRELLLRINNILKRQVAEADPSLEELKMGDFTFHVTRGELRFNGETVKLTERERELLRLFAQRAGETIPRHELATEETTQNERAVDVQINRLRRKIEKNPSNPVYLQTVRGKGYILHTD